MKKYRKQENAENRIQKNKSSHGRRYSHTWKSFAYCVALAWKASWVYTLLQFFSRMAAALIPIALTWNTKQIMDVLTAGLDGTEQIQWFGYCMLLLLLLYILRLLAGKVSTYVNAMLSDLLMHDVEREMAQTAVGMEIAYFDDPKYYDAFESVKRDIYSILGVLSDGMLVISYSMSAVSCVVMLYGVTPFFTLLILAATVPVAVSEYFYTKKVYWWGLEHMREERQMQYLYQTATGRSHAQEVRLYGLGGALVEKYQRLWDRYFSKKKRVVSNRAVWDFIFSVLPELLSAAALFSVGRGVLLGTHTVGDFTLYTGLLAQLTSALQLMIASVMGLYDKKLKVDHLSEFGRLAANKMDNGKRVVGRMPEIVFDHVSFCYPDTDAYVLRDISFCLNPGEKLCIVGENGSGKSTLLKLLLRFYEVQKGQILLDGVNIAEYDRNSLWERFGCFFQQADNYAFTLEENVRISRQKKKRSDGSGETEQAVEQALSMAGAGKLADTLPAGLATYLTRAFHEDGVELSGGQNQKVALARMFYRDAPILLMDEPTAALDPGAEHDLFCTIEKKCGQNSLIFVSHRLSNVNLADRILVMEHGCICAQGTHEELLAKCELYQKLYRYQADKYQKVPDIEPVIMEQEQTGSMVR